MEINKITLYELGKNTSSWEEAVIVFSKDSWKREYSEIERSYKISSDAKYFNPNMIGSSLFGNCLNGKDNGVRLDRYMSLLPEEGKRWKVDYCYITKHAEPEEGEYDGGFRENPSGYVGFYDGVK